MTKSTLYYDQTAENYDDFREGEREHTVALERSWPIIVQHQPRSVLDVGCGTGRALRWFRQIDPILDLCGVDPSQGMIDIAARALTEVHLTVGTGEQLPYDNKSIDVVTATGIMHHVDNPKTVIDEMARVARKAILISDHNNFAFGGDKTKRVRALLHALGLLDVATFVKQGFKRQGYSEEDGWWYPYSLFNNYADICRHADDIYIFPTRSPVGQTNLLYDQTHIAVVAIMRS